MKRVLKKAIYVMMAAITVSACTDGPERDIAQELYVNYPSINMFVGDEITVTASPTGSAFVWNSDNPAVAAVSKDGVVRAMGEGETDITVAGDGMQRTIPVNVTVKIPVTGISVSKTLLEMKPGESIALTAKFLPVNTNEEATVVWQSADPTIAKVTEGVVNAVATGSTVITASLTGNPSVKANIQVVVDYTFPFNGPHILSSATPCTIQARDFDYGGQGYAYYDTSNERGSPDYRPDVPAGSNIPNVEGGTHIGYIASGEWLQFTVNVADEGDYLVDFDITASWDGTVQLKADGVALFNPFTIPGNGSWGDFKWISERYPGTTLPQVHLTAGQHKLVLLFVDASYNFRALRFTHK